MHITVHQKRYLWTLVTDGCNVGYQTQEGEFNEAKSVLLRVSFVCNGLGEKKRPAGEQLGAESQVR